MKNIYLFQIYGDKVKISIKNKLFMIVGNDPVEASKELCKQLDILEECYEDFSMRGSWPISDKIDLSILWPCFTNNPPEWCTK